jgi:surfactin family lipopeptide synthetase C
MKAAGIEDIYDLSPLQESMLFHTLYDPAQGAYFEQVQIPFYERCDPAKLHMAWRRVFERHAVLRTSVHWKGLSKPYQVVHKDVQLPFLEKDWRSIPLDDLDQNLESYIESDRARRLDLEKPPLMRLGLIRLPDEEDLLLWSFHHILLDGWSVDLILQEFNEIYDALFTGREQQLNSVQPYRNYILWLQQQDLSAAETFWCGTLKDFAGPTPFHVDRPANDDEGQIADYAQQKLTLSHETTARLEHLARSSRLTLSTVMQGAWALLLSRYSQETDVMFGSIVSGRPPALPGVEAMVGLFINTLPVRVKVPGGARLLPWLAELQKHQIAARQFEYTPMARIQQWSEVPSGVPLFESILVFENLPGYSDYEQEDEEDESADAQFLARTNFPVCVIAMPGQRLLVSISYDCRRFEAPVVARMAGHLKMLLEEIAQDPNRSLDELRMITPAETHQLIQEWNSTSRDYSLTSLCEMFEVQAALRPDATAFMLNTEKISYRDLNERSNQLAHALKALGVGPEVLVAICFERSIDMTVALLGVLKAGGAFVPLDPGYPQARLHFMLKDAKASLLLTTAKLKEMFADTGVPSVLLDTHDLNLAEQNQANLGEYAAPNQLAYVIYTSGSVGTPKGVAVEHKQILNRLAWMWEAYPFDSNEVSCHKTALSFVDSIWEVFGGLLQGKPTALIPDEVLRDPYQFVRVLAECGVTRLWVVPSFLRVLLETFPTLTTLLPRLKFWVSTGEPLTAELADLFRRRMPHATLHNVYGTSEVWDVTWHDPNSADKAARRVPIGRPISNMQAYVLDHRLRPQPIGVPGELCVGGVGLARGYLYQSDLTAAKFVLNPFSREPGLRLYRSGDLARYTESGEIEYLGRIDHQLKIRGVRIEPGEVEAVLAGHPRVGQAVVVPMKDGPATNSLLAFVQRERRSLPPLRIANNGDGTPSSLLGPTTIAEQPESPDMAADRLLSAELRLLAESYLPSAMVPNSFEFVDRFPLTPSGKIDRIALAHSAGNGRPSEKVYVPPQTTVERKLSELYCEILAAPRAGLYDNFFRDLGGHSLLATRLLSRVRDAFAVELPLRAIFENPTVGALARVVESSGGSLLRA